jgi:hypothetical protein
MKNVTKIMCNNSLLKKNKNNSLLKWTVHHDKGNFLYKTNWIFIPILDRSTFFIQIFSWNKILFNPNFQRHNSMCLCFSTTMQFLFDISLFENIVRRSYSPRCGVISDVSLRIFLGLIILIIS